MVPSTEDPTKTLSRIRPPFTPHPRLRDLVFPAPAPTVATVPAASQSMLVDGDLYQKSLQIKDAYAAIEPYEFKRLVAATNPYENLRGGSFTNRAALKMANIDAVYKLTGNFNGLAMQQIRNDSFRFASIAEGPGGFVQYIQYRSTTATGHGITLQSRSDSLNWDVSNLDMVRFDIDYPGRTTGDIMTEWEGFCSYVISKTGPMNLVTADGGIDVGDRYAEQEQLNSRLIFTETLMALILVLGMEDRGPTGGGVVRGGDFVLKVFDTITQMSADIIYILTKCFERVSCIKPVTSRPANSERYIVCQNKRSNEEVLPWLTIMREAEVTMRNGTGVNRILTEVDSGFIDWLVENNNESFREAIHVGTQILDMASGKDVEIERVDLAKCLIVWDLPGPRDPVVCGMRTVPQRSEDRRGETPGSMSQDSRLNRRGRGRKMGTR
jgi:cap1 methyltransferase